MAVMNEIDDARIEFEIDGVTHGAGFDDGVFVGEGAVEVYVDGRLVIDCEYADKFVVIVGGDVA